MSSKFYTVFEGHSPGVYDNNADFMKQQKGYNRPRGKSFKTKTEADQALQEYNLSKQAIVAVKSKNNLNGQVSSVKKKYIGLKEEHSQFIACILLHLLLPLIPLLLEYIVTKNVSTQSLTLIAAIYSISIGRTTKNVAQFAISIVISLIFSACYGITVQSLKTTSSTAVNPENIINEYAALDFFAISVIVIIFIMHSLERYNKHVLDMVPFLNFKKD